MIKHDKERELRELKIAVGMIEIYDGHFVAYNTKFLGCSANDDFYINGQNVCDAKSINEFCFGYDGDYKQLHILHVYEMVNGTRFASTELSMGLYAYWEVTE